MDVLSLDPGGTTGWAYWKDTWKLEMNRGQVEGLIPAWQLLMEIRPDVVVCEGFYYQRREKVVLDSKEVIGIAKLWCHQFEATYVEQTPAIVGKKAFWNDNKLKELGLWIPNQVHAMDATRHLLYYMTFATGDDRWLNQLSP